MSIIYKYDYSKLCFEFCFSSTRITQAEMFINRRKKFILDRSLYSNLYQTIGIICNSNILITSWYRKLPFIASTIYRYLIKYL